MFRWRLSGLVAVLVAVGVGAQTPALAKSPPAPPTLVIGVDHLDLANQQPEKHRVFEYNDFFSRSVSVHRGEVLDFRFAPGSFHIVGLASDEEVARHVYAVASLDRDDPVKAIGTGLPKIELGPSNFSITGGSVHGGGTIGTDPSGNTPPPCGTAQSATALCTFKGGNDIEVAGPIAGFGPTGPASVDWQITVDAAPGDYDFLCFIHPGMNGRLRVVDSDDAVTSQAVNDMRGDVQFHVDQADALAAEAAANVVRFSGGLPGHRTYDVTVGVGAADRHANVLEMLPQQLNLVAGDKVQYRWKSPNEVHTVSFPADSPKLPAPFGFDCGSSFQNPPNGPGPFVPCLEPGAKQPELVGDPGSSPSGTMLKNPTTLVDAGLLVGRGYDLEPSSQKWSLGTNSSTVAATYEYQCTVHDFMHGTLMVTH